MRASICVPVSLLKPLLANSRENLWEGHIASFLVNSKVTLAVIAKTAAYPKTHFFIWYIVPLCQRMPLREANIN